MSENKADACIHEELPKSVKIYAGMVHWITIIASLGALMIPIFIVMNPSANILNPGLIFGKIFSGGTPDEIWALSSTGKFPGGHLYFKFPLAPDSWAQFFVNFGCSVGFWALIPTVLYQVFKEKDYFDAVIGGMLAVLIGLAMFGVLG